MSVNIYSKIKLKDYDFNICYRKIANEIVKQCFIFFGLDYKKFDIDISIVNNEIIKQINNDYRKVNKETDVLSFPYIDFDNGHIVDKIDYITQSKIFLGEMIISIEKCISQAKEYGHKLEREWAFLITHSMLHLFGLDHINKVDEIKMLDIQKIILKKANINR